MRPVRTVRPALKKRCGPRAGTGAGQGEGPAVFARRARADGVAQLRSEYIEAAGDPEIAEVIAGEHICRLKIGRAVERVERLNVGVAEHGLAQNDDIAEIGFDAEAGELRAPTEIAADMLRRV